MESCKTVVGKALFASCAWLLVSGVGFAAEGHDEQQIRRILSTCMDQAREHHTGRECDQFDRMCKEYGVAMLTYLEEYVADPCSRVRWRAYALMTNLARDADSIPERRRICDKLVKGLTLGRCTHIATWLLKFNFTTGDFSQESRALLTEELSEVLSDEKVALREEIILLSGVAELKSELPSLKQFSDTKEVILKERHQKQVQEWREVIERLPDTNNMPAFLPRRKRFEKQLRKQYWQSSLVWDALRARARMGVKEDIARCIELVESHPDEDYRVAWLLKELSYVRQPEVVDYLYTYLKSDKLEPYGGRDVIQLTYGQRAAIALGQMLRGFPWKKDYAANQEMIERCREWMAEQKQWDIIR